MRFLVPALLLTAALTTAGPADAQSSFGVGIFHVPATFHPGCNADPVQYPGIEMRSALPAGSFTLEGALGASGLGVSNDCLIVGPLHQQGIHTDLVQTVAPTHGRVHGELRGRWQTPDNPLSVQGGAGLLAPGTVPYLSAAAGLRSDWRLPIYVEVGRRWLRIPAERLTREWEDMQVVRTLASEPAHIPWSGWTFQIGVSTRRP